jgi:8-hydroxy-5-deazaflavin:NADPH oxidoreductase
MGGNKMKISIIGTGRMGKGLVKTLRPHIQSLQLASTSAEKAAGLIEEFNWTGVHPATYDEALKADIIFHSLWFRDLIPWVKKNAESLKGKIVVDIANPFTADFTDFTLDWGTSAAEELQKAIPDSKVVGAFKNTFFKVFDEPLHHGLQSDVYVTSDHADAKATVIKLLQPIPFRILDGGSLKNNRTIERMTLFERELAIRYDHYPYVSFRLFGLEQ